MWIYNSLRFLLGLCRPTDRTPQEPTRQGEILPNGRLVTTSSGTKLTSSDHCEKEAMPERGEWAGKLDFLFGCISYAVGLGNVWRFPYLCYENGGGAFLIPFFMCIIFCGIPLFVLEVGMGQYLSTGGIGIWDMVPIFKGIGFASMTMIGLCNIYYIVLIAWTLFYFFNSFRVPLPWSSCGNSWNTEFCLDPYGPKNMTSPEMLNLTAPPVKEYWERRVLAITDGLEETGSVRWELALCLVLAWVLVYLVIWRGLHQSGKIIWFTALFPYVILAILFVRGVTLEGAGDGLLFFITPKWEKLAEARVWVSAGTQVLFSYGVGIGANVALGSYNKYKHNFYKDSIIVCCISSGTSVFSGLVIFSVLGHMAHVQKTTVAAVAKSGPGLAFLAYPEVVTQLPFSPIWAVLFFLMLIILGIDSQFCTVEAFITGVVDEFASVLRPHRRKFTFGVVVIQLLLGLPLVTQGGMYIFQIMDFFSASGVTLLTVVFFEVVGFAYVYGARKIYINIKDMIGFLPNYFFFVCWVFVSPLFLIGIFLFSIIKYEPLTYADNYVYPWWGEMIGWFMALASILCLPVYAVYFLLKTPGTLKERLRAGITSVACPKSMKSQSEDKSISSHDGTPLSSLNICIIPNKT